MKSVVNFGVPLGLFKFKYNVVKILKPEKIYNYDYEEIINPPIIYHFKFWLYKASPILMRGRSYLLAAR